MPPLDSTSPSISRVSNRASCPLYSDSPDAHTANRLWKLIAQLVPKPKRRLSVCWFGGVQIISDEGRS
jgi:hypothetical protein